MSKQKTITIDELVKLVGAGEYEACERGARAWLKEYPDDVAAAYLLGLSLMRTDRVEESLEYLKVAAMQEPPQQDCVVNYGDALFGSGRYVEGTQQMARATRHYPECGAAHAKLAFMLMRCGMLVDAMASCMRSMQLEPNRADVAAVFATCLTTLGRPEEADAWFEKAAGMEAFNYLVQGERAFHFNYLAGGSRERALEEHLRYGEMVRWGVTPAERDVNLDPNRRLRVGVLSADLGDHPVARFLRGWLEHRNADEYEVYAYSNMSREDAFTDELRGLFTAWRRVRNMDDAAVDAQVRDDEIDILIDLSGLTGGSRLRVMAGRPAPVQMTYLGYPNTTGMGEIDYRIVDDLTDPAGEADEFAAERLLRLPAPFLCWAPPADAPEVRARDSSRAFTFGSFNYPGKMSECTLGLWRRVLEAVPGSRLLLKAKGFDEPKSRASVQRRLGECGLDLSRVELRGFAEDLRSHLAHYHDVDVALDPYPYHGTTTTCEALWMGVPVVSLTGDRHASRVGLTLLSAVGLDSMAARDEDHYVAIAAKLAARAGPLASLRASLRARMAGSALCDGVGFARKFEGALRAAWRQRAAQRQFAREAA